MSEMMKECRDLEVLNNPLEEMVDHKGDIGLVLSAGVIRDISIRPPIWHKDYTVDRTYFGPAVSGRIKKKKRGKNIEIRSKIIEKEKKEKLKIRIDKKDENNKLISLNDKEVEKEVEKSENGKDKKDDLFLEMHGSNKKLNEDNIKEVEKLQEKLVKTSINKVDNIKLNNAKT